MYAFIRRMDQIQRPWIENRKQKINALQLAAYEMLEISNFNLSRQASVERHTVLLYVYFEVVKTF